MWQNLCCNVTVLWSAVKLPTSFTSTSLLQLPAADQPLDTTTAAAESGQLTLSRDNETASHVTGGVSESAGRRRREAMEHFAEHHRDELLSAVEQLLRQSWMEDVSRRAERRRKDVEYRQHLLELKRQLLIAINTADNASSTDYHKTQLLNQSTFAYHATLPIITDDGFPRLLNTSPTAAMENSSLLNANKTQNRLLLLVRSRNRRDDNTQFDNVGGVEIEGPDKNKRGGEPEEEVDVPDSFSKSMLYTHYYKTVAIFVGVQLFVWVFCLIFGGIKIGCRYEWEWRVYDYIAKLDQMFCCRDQTYVKTKRWMGHFDIEAPSYEQHQELMAIVGKEEETGVDDFLKMLRPELQDYYQKIKKKGKKLDKWSDWIDKQTGTKK